MRADSGPYNVADALNAVNGQLLTGEPRGSFRGISTDSRDIKEGDLFAPLKGDAFDGHDFLIPALEAGARGSLVCRDIDRELHLLPSESVLIQVRDTYQALSDLASSHRLIYPTPLIAVTGSSGKTTVKEMIAAVLGRSHRPLVSEANFNNLVGLPMTVLGLGPTHDMAVVEAGINRPGEMEILSKAAAPDVAVITTVGPVHLEGLHSVENVASEKFKITTHMKQGGALVAPSDNEPLQALMNDFKGRILTFGVDSGDFRAEKIVQNDLITFEMIAPNGRVPVALKAPGFHNVRNALAAGAACWALGVSLEDIAGGLALFRPFKWRMEIRPLTGGGRLIYDCYNANPQSMGSALETLALIAGSEPALALLGDMKELGDYSERLHQELGALAARLNPARIVFVGEFGRSFAKGYRSIKAASGALSLCQDKQEAWDAVKDEITNYRAILVKGSRSMAMEELADRILEIA